MRGRLLLNAGTSPIRVFIPVWKHALAALHIILTVFSTFLFAADDPADARQPSERSRMRSETIQQVIESVDRRCREETIYMIGPKKAARLAELVREHKPKLVVECGSAIGYSGLWIARELEALGQGKLITIEIDPRRAEEAKKNFATAGLQERVEVRIGDARELVERIEGPVDFMHIDCNFSNYHPCLLGIEEKLRPGAVVVADNAGVGASGMADYLKHVRDKYRSKTEWFDIDLPWGKRDALEITIIAPKENEKK